MSGQQITSFPFQLEKELGKGGFASVYKGKFHQGLAAFKFIPIVEQGYKYIKSSVGCQEYQHQELIKSCKPITLLVKTLLYFNHMKD